MVFWNLLMLLLIFAYTPVATLQFYLLLKNILHKRIVAIKPRKEDRKVIVVTVTNGQNPAIVKKIVKDVDSFNSGTKQFVIKEYYDLNDYGCEMICVPKDYTTPNNSRKKMRALHYGINKLHEMGYDKETYIIHLDDDSFIDREYIEWVFSMDEAAGQGKIQLREYQHHLISTLADMGRVFVCDNLCRYFNSKGKPMEIHGEGLTIRADVEYEIGWDYGTYGAEDLMMGQNIHKHGYRFGFIPFNIYISPPTNTKDFYKQRRRWAYSLIWSIKEIRAIRPIALYWLLYRYITTWTGLVGLLILPYTLSPFTPVNLPIWVYAISVFNTISYFSTYQYGAAKVKKRYMPIMLVMQLLVAAYEGLTFPFGLLFPPDKMSFDVIKKV